jgi:hypothetical protein
MALNWTMLGPDRTPVPLPHETTITVINSGVEVILRVPDEPPSESSRAGGSGGSKTLKATGKVTVTDQRVRRASGGLHECSLHTIVYIHQRL